MKIILDDTDEGRPYIFEAEVARRRGDGCVMIEGVCWERGYPPPEGAPRQRLAVPDSMLNALAGALLMFNKK